MEEIFKQYGAPIITVSVIVALIAIFAFLLTNDGGHGVILDQFQKLITDFFNEARFTPAHSTIVAGMSLLG